jgi:hypothetical protein
MLHHQQYHHLLSPLAFCQAFTAASVFGPNVPIASTPSFTCNFFTSSPLDPTFSNISFSFSYKYDIYKKINVKDFLKMKLTKEQLMGILRHGLTFIGGLLIMKGVVDEAAVEEVIGGVITLAGTIWSIVVKNKA